MTRIALAPPLALWILATALTLSACDSGKKPAARTGGAKVTYLDKTSIPKDPAEQVFQQTCMGCHATGVGPVITGRDLPPAAIKLFVRNGNRAMPAFTEAMIDNATLDRVAQLVSQSKAPAPPTNP